MNKRKFNLKGWYRRFFLSERTSTVAAVLARREGTLSQRLSERAD